jgi:hypothetical protein
MRNSDTRNTSKRARIPPRQFGPVSSALTVRPFRLLLPARRVFVCSLIAEKYTLYMGRDKIENEDLIKFGWAQDVWFHVSNLSSAHVYLRMEDGMTLKQIPPRQYSDPGEQRRARAGQGIAAAKRSPSTLCISEWLATQRARWRSVGAARGGF